MKKIDKYFDSVIEGYALETLNTFPDECIDITVTSPPYNKRRNSFGWLVQNNGYSHYNDSISEEKYQEWQINILNELYRITKPGGSLFYNHKIRWKNGVLLHPFEFIMKSDWNLRQEIIWDRSIAANVRGWRFYQVEEHIYWMYKPIGDHLVGRELESRHAKMSSIWRIKPVPRNENHPASFPLELPIRAIYSMPGEDQKVILDPFCGTGTTLVAAKILDHHYIGIDISPDYVEYARKRLQDYLSEIEIAENEMSLHVVKDPFRARKKRGTVSWPFGPNGTENTPE